MSIQKKSLISTLKTAKKANFAGKHEAELKGEKTVSAVKVGNLTTGRGVTSAKSAQLTPGRGVTSAKSAQLTPGRGVTSAKSARLTPGRGVSSAKKFNPRILV